jgi:hypothetical protein
MTPAENTIRTLPTSPKQKAVELEARSQENFRGDEL